MPELTPRQPRRDATAADARSLEQMGRIEPQPTPAPTPSIQPFLEPDLPPADETDDEHA